MFFYKETCYHVMSYLVMILWVVRPRQRDSSLANEVIGRMEASISGIVSRILKTLLRQVTNLHLLPLFLFYFVFVGVPIVTLLPLFSLSFLRRSIVQLFSNGSNTCTSRAFVYSQVGYRTVLQTSQ